MDTREIIAEIIEKGYEVREVETNKNGTLVEGISFIKHPITKETLAISPIIRTEWLKDADDVSQKALDIFLSNKKEDVGETVFNQLKSREDIEKHLYIRVQPKSLSDGLIIKPTPFDGIDQFLCISVRTSDCTFSIKTKFDVRHILQKYSITEEEAWEIALRNVEQEAIICDMFSLLLGEGYPLKEPSDNDGTLYIISNKNNVNGASSILSDKVLKEAAEKLGNPDKMVILPSSIHEVIVARFEGDINLAMMTQMVQEINQSEVRPEERLSNQAYIIETEGNNNLPKCNSKIAFWR